MATLTRKELAAQLGISYDTLVRREKEWGLDKCILKKFKRPIQYDAEKIRLTLLRNEIK